MNARPALVLDPDACQFTVKVTEREKSRRGSMLFLFECRDCSWFMEWASGPQDECPHGQAIEVPDVVFAKLAEHHARHGGKRACQWQQKLP